MGRDEHAEYIAQTTKNRFGALLRSLRERLKWSQKEGAQKSGISTTYLSQLELGQRNPPSREIIRRIAHAYAVNENVLLEASGYEENPKSKISPERIEWAFRTMCDDPSFVFGTNARQKAFDLDTKALLVEIYSQCSGRNLFIQGEDTAATDDLASMKTSAEALIAATKTGNSWGVPNREFAQQMLDMLRHLEELKPFVQSWVPNAPHISNDKRVTDAPAETEENPPLSAASTPSSPTTPKPTRKLKMPPKEPK